MRWICATCGQVYKRVYRSMRLGVVAHYGYWWHVPCYEENEHGKPKWDGPGRLIPETICHGREER